MAKKPVANTDVVEEVAEVAEEVSNTEVTSTEEFVPNNGPYNFSFISQPFTNNRG